MKTIIFIIIVISNLIGGIFSRENEVVTDSRTNLEWQDNTESKTTKFTWMDAINYCENLDLDGNSDWRLPNINELISLVDDTIYNPAIDRTFVNTNTSSWYWSSTSHVHDSKVGWIVYFYYGNQHLYGKNGNFYVRCVRTGD